MNLCTLVSQCRCCGGKRLESVLDFGDMPLANGFHSGEPGPRFPLNLMVCQDCWHGQLSAVVAGEVLFRDYAYLSSLSRTFADHCARFVIAAKGMVAAPCPAALDIGCNDGILLSMFRDVGCDVLGVDPAANLRPFTDRLGIPVVNAFWGAECAASLGRKFDIITAQNVFAHVHDFNDFLAGCDIALNPGGVVLIEFPYSLDMIARNEFDTIYHEHLNFFLVNSFACLIDRSPFYIASVERSAIHGGSVRFALKKRPGTTNFRVHALIQAERAWGMFDLRTYEEFRTRVECNRAEFREMVASTRARGERVVGYCASAKGAVMLNHFDVDLDYVVDDTPLKQGRFMPGRSIPIVGPEELEWEKDPVNIVVLSWNLMEEIEGRIRSLRGSRDNLLSYVPEVCWRPCCGD